MLVRDAYNLCDKIIVVEPKMDLYQKHSALFFAFLEKLNIINLILFFKTNLNVFN